MKKKSNAINRILEHKLSIKGRLKPTKRATIRTTIGGW